MRRDQNKPGPRPAPILQPHPSFLKAVRGSGLPLDHLRRAAAHVCSPRTVTTILAGSGKCTAISLGAMALLAELVGAPQRPRRDQIVVGLVIDPPPIQITIRALKVLASQSAQAKAFVGQRLQQLEHFHTGFGLIDPGAL